MPRDKRLWMTFPIDFWTHPKIAPLSDAAFRAFVEINGYSRQHDLDGRVPVRAAESVWPKKALAELTGNHVARPSLSIDGDEFVIWNYSEHQQTSADREEAARVSRENGKRGGRPRKEPANNPAGFTPGSAVNPDVSRAKAESESELETETDNTDRSSHLPSGPSSVDLTDQHVSAIQAELAHHADIEAQGDEARAFGVYVLSNAKTAPRNPAAYVKSSIAYNPTEVSQWFKQHRRGSKGVTA